MEQELGDLYLTELDIILYEKGIRQNTTIETKKKNCLTKLVIYSFIYQKIRSDFHTGEEKE